MRILLMFIALLTWSALALAQGTWQPVELPESYIPLPSLKTANPLAPTNPSVAASTTGNLVFFGKHSKKGIAGVWFLAHGEWLYLLDFSKSGIPASQLLPFPAHTWTPVMDSVGSVYVLDGNENQEGRDAAIMYRGKNAFQQMASSADKAMPFQYLATDESTGEVFFLGQPTVIVRKPPYNIPQEALADYGIYRIDNWRGYNPFDRNSEPPITLILPGTADEQGYKPVGPLHAGDGHLVFWSARGSLPRLERFNNLTGGRQILLSLVEKTFGQNVRRIHSAVTDEQGTVYAAYTDSVGRIAVFPVQDEPKILHSFNAPFPAGFPPALLLHDVYQGRLLFSYTSGRSNERDMLTELDTVSQTVRTIMGFGDFVLGRTVSSIGQFAAFYKDGAFIVQVNPLGDDFGMLISGTIPDQAESENFPKSVTDKIIRRRTR